VVAKLLTVSIRSVVEHLNKVLADINNFSVPSRNSTIEIKFPKIFLDFIVYLKKEIHLRNFKHLEKPEKLNHHAILIIMPAHLMLICTVYAIN